jgi:hypothetical protein
MSFNQKKSAPVLNNDVQTIIDGLPSTAARVRYLASMDFSRGDISRILNIRYQWVRNVLETKLKS